MTQDQQLEALKAVMAEYDTETVIDALAQVTRPKTIVHHLAYCYPDQAWLFSDNVNRAMETARNLPE